MMISPALYKEKHKSSSLKELMLERNKLMREINEYEDENILHTKQHKNIGIIIDPSPEVRYSCYNEYLKEITNLIIERQQESKNFLKNDIVIKIRRTNWGEIGLNDWTDEIWKIYDDLTVDIEKTYNRVEHNIETTSKKITKKDYNMILKSIELSKGNNIKVEAFDGEVWEIIQYAKGQEVWKKELGHIYGVKPLETIAKIVMRL